MALLFESLLTNVLVCLLAVTLAIIIYFKHAFNYWKKRKVPEVKKPIIPFGTIPIPPKDNIGCHFKDMYDAGKRNGHKHVGAYLCSVPYYICIDRECIKNILQRDFNCFTERGFYYNEKDDPLSANLLAIGGEKWRILRQKLSPAFTAGKLKVVLDRIVQCSYPMQEEIEKVCNSTQIVNINDIAECFTVDVIGSCAFGLECNSFKHPEAEFRKQGQKVLCFTVYETIRNLFAVAYPNLARFLRIRIFDKPTTDFFTNVVTNSVKYREANKFAQKDFLQLLFDLKDDNIENPQDKSKFSLDELTAQLFIFFLGGFETSSITLSFCVYELATNADIQDRTREEINRILKNHGGKITYDAIMEMKYLNQVVEETMRKYPPLSFVSREAVKDYQIPGTEIVLEKGMVAMVTILGLHHDPEYFPNPEKFDPERFSDENKQRLPPFSYIPFGEGPRICIGLRLGLMQVKVGVVALLTRFKFSLNRKTRVPVEMNPYTINLTVKNEIFLDVQRADQ